jgi:hypothetical protein
MKETHVARSFAFVGGVHEHAHFFFVTDSGRQIKMAVTASQCALALEELAAEVAAHYRQSASAAPVERPCDSEDMEVQFSG